MECDIKISIDVTDEGTNSVNCIHGKILLYPDDIVVSPTLTFAAGNTTNMDSVQVTVVDDGIYERSEQVTVSIASVQPASVALIREQHAHTFTVRDNNGMCITVSGMSADKVWSQMRRSDFKDSVTQ